MEEEIVEALKAHALGEIAKAKTNVKLYMHNPAGIGEHSDILEAIQTELDKIAESHDRLDVLDKYFSISE